MREGTWPCSKLPITHYTPYQLCLQCRPPLAGAVALLCHRVELVVLADLCAPTDRSRGVSRGIRLVSEPPERATRKPCIHKFTFQAQGFSGLPFLLGRSLPKPCSGFSETLCYEAVSPSVSSTSILLSAVSCVLYFVRSSF